MSEPELRSTEPVGPIVERLEWVPSDDGTGLVRVSARQPAPPSGLPLLEIDGPAGTTTLDSLPDARSDAPGWRATYVVDAALAAGAPLRLRFADGSGVELPELSIEADAPKPPAEPEPGQVVDRAVLAERRAKRAAREAADGQSARDELTASESGAAFQALQHERAARAAVESALDAEKRRAAADRTALELRLDGELAALGAERDAQHRQLLARAEAAERARAEAEARLATLQRATDELHARLEAANAELAPARAAAERAEAALEVARSELERERAARAAEAEALAGARSDVAFERARVEADVARALRERDESARIAEALRTLLEAEQQRAAHSTELARQWAPQLRELYELADVAARGIAEARDRARELEAALAAQQTRAEQSEREIAQQRTAAAAERQAFEAAAVTAAEQLAAAQAAAADAAAQLASVERQLEQERTLRAETERLAGELNEARETIHDLRRALTAERRVEAERAERALAEARVAELTAELAAVTRGEPARSAETLAADLDAARAALQARVPASAPAPPAPAASAPAPPAAAASAPAPPAAAASAPAPPAPAASAPAPPAPAASAPAPPVVYEPPATPILLNDPRPLRTALVVLAKTQPDAAARLLIALAGAQHALVAEPYDFDLTLAESGTFAIAMGGGRTAITELDRPRKRDSDFRVRTDALGLAQLLAGARRRPRRTGRVKVRGKARQARALLAALRDSAVSAERVLAAGVRPDPADLAPLLPIIVPPPWTLGHRFCLALELGADCWFVEARSGDGVAVHASTPPEGMTVDTRVALSPAGFRAFIAGQHGDQLEVAGDPRPLALLSSWIAGARSGYRT